MPGVQFEVNPKRRCLLGSCCFRSMRLLAMAGAMTALSAAALAQTAVKVNNQPTTTSHNPASPEFNKLRPNPLRAHNTPADVSWSKEHGPAGGVVVPQPAPRGVSAADNCGDAPTVGDGVYNWDLSAATNDGPYGACGLADLGPDVWLRWVPTADGTADVSICGLSGDDTVLAAVDQCGGTELACNDDNCAFQSEIFFPVTAGEDYFIRIAGFNGGIGAGQISIGLQQPCVLTPPGPGTPEGEDCGADINGGCNSDPNIFGSITCGEVVEGTAWADANFRDTDWYELTLDGLHSVTVVGQAQFPLQLFIIDANCPATIIAAGAAGRCEMATVTATVSGSCRIFAGNTGFSGNPCGSDNNYWIQVTDCSEVQPPDCADCPKGGADEGEPDCGLPVDTVNGGCNSTPQVFGTISVGGTVCGTAGNNGGTRDTDWYQVDLTEGTELTWTVTPEFPCLIGMVATGCSGAFIGGTAFTTDTCVPVSATKCLAAGTYYMFVAPSAFGGVPCGARYIGTLTGVPCDATAPDNDTCANARTIAVGGSDSGDTSFASDDGLVGCGTPAPGAGVWYVTTGTGNTMTASLCNSTYDTVINVFCGAAGCDGLTCIAGDDDFCAFAGPSQVSFCSQNGGPYYIHVGGFGGATGLYTLDVTDDGTPCNGAQTCITTGACCTANGCQVLTPTDCAAANGTYQGDGSNCGGQQTYAAGTCNDAFEDISSTGTLAPNASNCDDCGDNLPIGFTFNFFGTDHTDINVSSDGYLTFGATTGDFSNDPSFPNPAEPNDMIAPYWDDWQTALGGDIYYQTIGSAPNRHFVVQWQGVQHFGSTDEFATFEAILSEGSNNIAFRYGALDPRDTPTIGIENSTGTVGVDVPVGTQGTCTTITNTISPNPCQATCACDFNHDNVLNSQDFFDFLNCFFTNGCANGDFNHDNVVNSQDFFDFLNCFFQPPAGCH
jgi:hypothetical protein